MQWTCAVYMFVLAASVLAQTDGSCGTDITASRQYYEIKFFTYCQKRLSSYGNPLPIRQSSFKDCSVACVAKGKSCGGFAFDRTSHFSENNCYLNAPTASWQAGTAAENAYFDSATIDNSSLPLTRTDCSSSGSNGVYDGFNLRCGHRIAARDDDRSQISTIFASSISDCIDHCRNTASCQAVTWDPTVLYGYQNCYMKASGYFEPGVDAMWDSATLIGTTGQPVPNATTNTSSTSSSLAATSTGTSATPTSTSNGGGMTPPTKIGTAGLAGIVVCSILALLILISTVVWYIRRRRRNRAEALNDPTTTENEPAMSDVPGSAGLMSGVMAKGDEAVNVHEIHTRTIHELGDGQRYEADNRHMINEADGNASYRWA